MILAKTELMMLVFMASKFLVGFVELILLSGESRICQTDEEMHIGL